MKYLRRYNESVTLFFRGLDELESNLKKLEEFQKYINENEIEATALNSYYDTLHKLDLYLHMLHTIRKENFSVLIKGNELYDLPGQFNKTIKYNDDDLIKSFEFKDDNLDYYGDTIIINTELLMKDIKFIDMLLWKNEVIYVEDHNFKRYEIPYTYFEKLINVISKEVKSAANLIGSDWRFFLDKEFFEDILLEFIDEGFDYSHKYDYYKFHLNDSPIVKKHKIFLDNDNVKEQDYNKLKMLTNQYAKRVLTRLDKFAEANGYENIVIQTFESPLRDSDVSSIEINIQITEL